MHQRDYVPEGEIGYRALATQPSVRRAALIARFHSGCHTLRQFARPVAHPSVTRPRGDGCLRRLRGRRPALVMSGGSPVRCSDTKASQRFPQVGHTSGVFARVRLRQVGHSTSIGIGAAVNMTGALNGHADRRCGPRRRRINAGIWAWALHGDGDVQSPQASPSAANTAARHVALAGLHVLQSRLDSAAP